VIPTATTTRRCFCLQCARRPEPGHWHCPDHELQIHQASQRASERQQASQQSKQPKTARCRMGACTGDPRLPEVHFCDACRRAGIERRKLSFRKEAP